MHLPSAIGLYFLAYLLLLLPWLAHKGARRFAAAVSATPGVAALPSRSVIWRNTLISMLLLGALTWLAGRDFEYPFLVMEHFTGKDLAVACAAMALNASFFMLSRRWRTEEERRKLAVWRLVPRTTVEWSWAVACLVVTGVVEEAAYRGVAMSLLWWATGSAVIAVVASALAFALAHAVQGRRSMLIIFGMALVAHGLVALTDTLVIAMVVHMLYDLGAIIASSRRAAMYVNAD